MGIGTLLTLSTYAMIIIFINWKTLLSYSKKILENQKDTKSNVKFDVDVLEFYKKRKPFWIINTTLILVLIIITNVSFVIVGILLKNVIIAIMGLLFIFFEGTYFYLPILMSLKAKENFKKWIAINSDISDEFLFENKTPEECPELFNMFFNYKKDDFIVVNGSSLKFWIWKLKKCKDFKKFSDELYFWIIYYYSFLFSKNKKLQLKISCDCETTSKIYMINCIAKLIYNFSNEINKTK
ncbi:MAG0920 family protein [Metamycoplasma hyosynoviae]